jgi:hypothetical protein
MVAITVVLAAVIFVVVTSFGQGKEQPPDSGFIRDENHDKLEIIKISPAVERSKFEIRMSAPGDFDVDAPLASGMHAIPTAGEWVPLANAQGGPGDGFVEPGTYIAFCAEGAGEPVLGVHVDFRYLPTNSIIWQDTFVSMASCP